MSDEPFVHPMDAHAGERGPKRQPSMWSRYQELGGDELRLYLHADGKGVRSCSGSMTPPTREELIHGAMSVPTYYPTINDRGWSVMGPAHWMDRARAELYVDNNRAWMAGWPCLNGCPKPSDDHLTEAA